MNKTALIIIDIQNDYFENGANPLKDSLEAAAQASRVLKTFREKKGLVVHIQHHSVRPGSTFFIPGTYGLDFHKMVEPRISEKIFIKNFPNSFLNTGLQDYLKDNNISNIVFCGMMTHMCLDATVRQAKDLGYKCTVISDATASKELVFNKDIIPADYVKKSFLASLNYFYAELLTAEEFIKLQKKAE